MSEPKPGNLRRSTRLAANSRKDHEQALTSQARKGKKRAREESEAGSKGLEQLESPESKQSKKSKQSVVDSSETEPSHSDVRYFLMKAEPESRLEKGKDVKFSIDDLAAVGHSSWDGVRNHEARNNMQSMRVGDLVLFYHSNCKQPGIAGIAKVSKLAYPDHTAWDSSHPYFDKKSNPEKPTWYMVDVEFVRKLDAFLPLKLLQEQPELKNMQLIRRSRLSVSKVTAEEFKFILSLEKSLPE
ncbi:thymocyte nuclear protein 1 [Zopfochytrium polystomum]|nr:thymocyte nuclear protein 1 [Zopfochytrium polystomum]